MPSLLLVHGYRVFFWSNELNEPVHVHVAKGDPTPDATMLWLTKAGGCVVAHNKGRIPQNDLNELLDIISANHKLICDEWERFFGVHALSFLC